MNVGVRTFQNATIVGSLGSYSPPYFVLALRSSKSIGELTPPNRICNSC